MSHDNLPTKPQDSTVVPQLEKDASQAAKLSKVVSAQVRDIRGNAKWDAIKFFWNNYQKWLPYVVWGWTVLSAALAALVQKIRGVPIDWLIIGLLALFSLAPFLTVLLLSRRKGKKVSPISDTSPTPIECGHDEQINQQYIQITKLEDEKVAREKGIARAAEQHKTEIGSLQHLAETHSIRASMNQGLLDQYKWLHDIADTQAKDISSYVTITKITLGDIRLGVTMPYVRFGIYISNYSVFDITVVVEQGGGIVFGARALNTYPLKVLHNDLVDAPHMTKGCVTIEQPLRREEADYVHQYDKVSNPNFYFDGLNITVEGSTRFPQVKAKPLAITKGVSIDGGPLTFGGGTGADEGEAERDKRNALKEELKKILDYGYNVSLAGRNTVYESEVDEYNRWRARAEGFVRTHRDESDVKRFQKDGLLVLEEFLKDYLD